MGELRCSSGRTYDDLRVLFTMVSIEGPRTAVGRGSLRSSRQDRAKVSILSCNSKDPKAHLRFQRPMSRSGYIDSLSRFVNFAYRFCDNTIIATRLLEGSILESAIHALLVYRREADGFATEVVKVFLACSLVQNGGSFMLGLRSFCHSPG